MRFYKALLHDLRSCSPFRIGLLLPVICFSALLFLSFYLGAFHLYYFDLSSPWAVNTLPLGFGDILLSQAGGSLPMRIEVPDQFVFPTTWMLLHMFVCYFTMTYMREDLTQGGIQVITRIRRRQVWWASKCIWNMLTVTCFFFFFYGALFLLCVVIGFSMSLFPNEEYFTIIFSQNIMNQISSQSSMALCLMILPWIVSLAVNMAQMALTTFIRPIFAYIISCCWLLLGIYYAHPLVVTNYAIPVRSETIGIYSFQAHTGIVLSLGIIVLAVIVGMYGNKRKDILIREEGER